MTWRDLGSNSGCIGTQAGYVAGGPHDAIYRTTHILTTSIQGGKNKKGSHRLAHSPIGFLVEPVAGTCTRHFAGDGIGIDSVIGNQLTSMPSRPEGRQRCQVAQLVGIKRTGSTPPPADISNSACAAVS
jgi:hypothetical protein